MRVERKREGIDRLYDGGPYEDGMAGLSGMGMATGTVKGFSCRRPYDEGYEVSSRRVLG
jgi:hypothetical protein